MSLFRVALRKKRAEAYTVAMADAWGVTHSGHYLNSGRYYLGGVYVGTKPQYEEALVAIDADVWGITQQNNGEYLDSGRYYLNGAYVGDLLGYTAALAAAAPPYNWGNNLYSYSPILQLGMAMYTIPGPSGATGPYVAVDPYSGFFNVNDQTYQVDPTTKKIYQILPGGPPVSYSSDRTPVNWAFKPL